MTTHELHPVLNEVSHQLKIENPGLEFRHEANGNTLSLYVLYPDGGESRYSLELTDKDEIIPLPSFHAVAGKGDSKDINDSKLSIKWVAMLKERVQKTGIDYSYDEAGGEG